jgi:ligand-binding sensor domain-containing protein/DNA-binding CsgD family transcriptional regulator
MWYRIKILSLISIILLASNQGFPQKIFSGLPFINNYSPEEYGAGIQNWQITQDDRGMIYVANNFGVLEYDGSAWYLYPVPNGTKIRSAAINKQGKIFIGSQGDFGYFFPDKTGSYQYTSLVDSLPVQFRNIDEVWRVFIDEEKVYFCTFSNIYKYEDEKLHTIQTNLYLEPSHFINNQLYVQSPGNSLMTLGKEGKLKKISGGELFKDKLVAAILPHSKDQILIITKNSGSFLYDGISTTSWRREEDHFLENSVVNCAIRMRDGRIAIGTQSKGLIILDHDGNLLLHLNLDNGLANNTVLSLYQDIGDNLWAGLNNGLSQIEIASPFSSIGHDMGVEGTGYTALIDDNTLYLGTNIGLYRSSSQINDANIHSLKFTKVNQSDGQVYNILKIRNSIIMGHHSGAFEIRDATAERISNTGAWTFLISPFDHNKLIQGTYSGISFLIKEDKKWLDTENMEGFYESSRIMELDDENNLWMTHGYKGAFKLKIDYENEVITDVKFYNSNHGFPSDILINVFKIKNELLFTAESGIYIYDEQSDLFKLHEGYEELLGPYIHIRDMDEDPLGNVYFITNDQCGVIRQNGTKDPEVEYDTFNKIPKLLNDDLVNVNALDMNNVIFAGKEGFIHYEANKTHDISQEFTTLIRKVQCITGSDSTIFDGNFIVDGHIVENQTNNYNLELPYTNNDIRFTYSAPFYEGISDLRYRFFLRNFDKDWSDWNTKTEKEYTNLPEGEYEFMVMAQNIFMRQSKLATYKFRVLSPWYRTYVAYGIYASIGLTILLISMMFVDRKHKKDKIQLKRSQKEELTNKDVQLETIQKEKEEEITHLKNEKLNAELNHKNTELTSVTMHLLTKNELIGDIKNKLSGIKSQDDKTEIKRSLSKILKEIEASTYMDKDWEQLEFHFDRVHRDFSKRIKKEFPQLTAQEMKLCTYLRLNFTTKEIAQLLHISVRGVEISRYRLRKKLKLDRDQNLSEFILEF